MFQLPIEITSKILEEIDTISLHRFSTTCVHIPEYEITMDQLTNNLWKKKVDGSIAQIEELLEDAKQYDGNEFLIFTLPIELDRIKNTNYRCYRKVFLYLEKYWNALYRRLTKNANNFNRSLDAKKKYRAYWNMVFKKQDLTDRLFLLRLKSTL